MAAITQFTPFWFPGRAYGTFTAKTAAAALDLKAPQIDSSLKRLGQIRSLKQSNVISSLKRLGLIKWVS